MVRSREKGRRCGRAKRVSWAARAGLALAFAVAVGGCAPGAPARPAALVNPNGISDDIWAASMGRSDGSRPADPNVISVAPKSYETRPR